VGILLPFAETDTETRVHLNLFRERLVRLGWNENRNLRLTIRYGGGIVEQIRNSARELVSAKPDLILTRSTPATKAVVMETKTIPTVFVVVSDPVGDGLVTSIARPGGNVTGFTNVEASLAGKWLEVLKETSPTLTRVAIIFDPKTSPGGGYFYSGLVQKAAPAVAVTTTLAVVRNAQDVDRVIREFSRGPNGGLIVLPDVTTGANRNEIVRLASEYRLPAVYSYRYIAEEGGLASYGVNVGDLFSRSADYVDRILRGELPGNLPVQAPTKFELVINMKTAKALALNISPMLIGRADEIIE
jgi:putative ABC transport system substrate-binding protein